jgi:hypothetical protein
MNSLILPTTADNPLITSSFPKRTPQLQRGQHLLPPFIFLFLQVVDIAINIQ